MYIYWLPVERLEKLFYVAKTYNNVVAVVLIVIESYKNDVEPVRNLSGFQLHQPHARSRPERLSSTESSIRS